MHVYKYIVAMSMAIVMMLQTVPVFASDMIETTANEVIEETIPVVDTITIENELMWDGDVPADIRWKTKQDKGQWIEELEVLEGATSLILIVNNLDKEEAKTPPVQETDSGTELKQELVGPGYAKQYFSNIEDMDGLSSLLYLSKNAEGEWIEILSANCMISGGESLKNEEVYGIYCPERTFGNLKNPGSLLPYKEVNGDDYWILNPKDERYGDIYTTNVTSGKLDGAINISAMKIYFNYGMIAKKDRNDDEGLKLLLNCYHPEAKEDQFAGVQIPEDTLRFLIQCVDEGTRMVIVGSVDELANLS